MPKKAFVDTTVIADLLAKPRSRAAVAKAALRTYANHAITPYALKEFQLGVLSNLAWFHNLCANLKSWAAVTGVLVSEGRTPRRYRKATVDEFLHEVAILERDFVTTPAQQAEYGDAAEPDVFRADLHRLECLRTILSAWKKRRRFVPNLQAVHELSCFLETAPHAEGLGISFSPDGCRLNPGCVVAREMRNSTKRRQIQKLRAAAQEAFRNNPKPENRRRLDAIEKLLTDEAFTTKDCRRLGDAVFAFFCPADFIVLTSNVADHEPLCAALKKNAEGYPVEE